jgi:hypothetical protein
MVGHACNPTYSGGKDQEDHSVKSAGTNSSWDPTGKYLTQSLVGVPLPWPVHLIWPALLGHCSWLPARSQPQRALAVQASPGTYTLQLLFLRSETCSLPQGEKVISDWDLWGARVELGLVFTRQQNTYWFLDGGSTPGQSLKPSQHPACGVLHSSSSCSQQEQSPHMKLHEECQNG